MLKIFKILFFSTLIMSILITISSYSWMGMWIGLEINLLSIIPLMNNKNNLFSSESSIKYFITQALASTTLMLSIILLSTNFYESNNIIMIFNSALLMKMGAAPFHFWFPEIIEGLSWMNSLIMLTVQKIAPMLLIMMNNYMFILMIILISMFVSGSIGLNQTSLRKILVFSSINHISWMLAALMFLKSIWLIYFSIYFIISMNIVFMLNKYNIFYIKQLFSFNNFNLYKSLFMMNMISLGGLPPLLGFFPKWLVIQSLINNNLLLTAFLMVMLTLITLYFYMRISFTALIINVSQMNFKPQSKFKIYWMMFFNLISLNSLILVTLTINLS